MTAVELVTVSAEPGFATGPAEAVTALAALCETHGLPVRGRRVVAADETAVVRALGEAAAAGGLVLALAEGPAGDVLRQALARLLGARLVLSSRMLDALASEYAARGQAMPRRAEALALVPQGATVLSAPGGGEPGLLAETGGALVAILPAAPAAAVHLAREQVLPRVPRRGPEPVTASRTLRLVGAEPGVVEGALAGVLREADGVQGRVVEIGPELWVRLRARGPTLADAETRLRDLEPALRGALGAAWYGEGDETLEAKVGRLLRARGLTVALAESCTGGLVGHRLTQVPGSSAYVERGVVVYSNAAKQALLGVPAEVLATHGAVSAPCAEAMARGVRDLADTDLGVSVTGIAGPDGGTPTKPVGLVFIGLADRAGATSHRFRFDRDREGNKALSAALALDLIRRYCLDRP